MEEHVIIGNGPAGISAVEAIRERNKNDHIKLITKEKSLPYARIALADVLQGSLEEKDISIRSKNFFSKQNIEVLSETKVISINPSTKTITVEDGEKTKQKTDYSKLLISTGASPITPPIDGVKANGVFTLGSLSDVWKIQEYVKEKDVETCIIVGAGFIGLEATEALVKLDIDIHLVELLDRILPNLLDKSTSVTLHKDLEEANINTHLSTKLEKIEGDPVESAIVESENFGKEKISCDLVILAVGMRPNIEFLKNGEIKTDNGIIVNENMETSSDDIFAAGDVAEAYNIFGERCINLTWPSAVFQGEVAGTNMANGDKNYIDLRRNIINVIYSKIVSLGRTPTQAKNENLEIIRKSEGEKVRIGIFDSNKLVGFTSLGSERAIMEAGVLGTLIRKGFEPKNKKEILSPYSSTRKLLEKVGFYTEDSTPFFKF
ncbi:hypothetical protein AKJ37_02295 [candidate division MSBL1 archaeon SCGC-AAA259I09]|uniref:FAD/NAD(P)-binding domain-containing protein n=2 Tax=candidate division MSBL1 TaxID=215777 RepID=A0A133UPA5_9EURY|nr:hypothetical protein AKJ38_04070 [candidate division MSBL1 archaeon SCGC-AAA259I14]KXA97806.1 hypothetical protein AKJ37_02295 [candidate division MSBL1 archaeon SCGC-AAA259I09]